MQPLALRAEALAFWVPQENGAKKGERQCTYMLSGIARGGGLLASSLAH
jgi:hypothetical protein